MQKVLKKYTTIPQHLYVKRSADKQLIRIIQEMERPGYVLVARQMGKTNLLFNAKRELENDENLFVYVDLSNNFSEERECYRNIIDTIIDSRSEKFEGIANKIYERRDASSIPPHKEYIRELRQILNEFRGKLIIILDEIDALRSVSYSDHIFAQIRSNYFARTNFPEFKNLTYVLSGVIEPTELIKDKNKSPFNIGEKIYLDDFVYSEHKEFISKSCLAISEEVIQNIYNWANGNPRLTFDICSEVEDYIIDYGTISTDIVDNIIEKKYLTTYDIAPIDHIRDLISTNRNLRKAVISIQKGNADLSDDIKQKLYLYGIIESNKPKIKNKILSRSLTLEWLDSVEKQNQDLFTLGMEKISNGELTDAISLLEEYAKSTDAPKTNVEIGFYNIGFAYFKSGDYRNALKAFSVHPFSKEEGKELYYYDSLSMIGICNLVLGNGEDGCKQLEEVVSTKSTGFSYHNSLLNLATYYLKHDNQTRAIELFRELLDSLNSKNDTDSKKLKVLAHYFLANVAIDQADHAVGIEEIRQAKLHAEGSDILELIYTEYSLSKKEPSNAIVEIAEKILIENFKFNENENYEISYSVDNNYKYLLELYRIDSNFFEELLQYTVDIHFGGHVPKHEVLFEMASSSEDISLSIKILSSLLGRKEEFDGHFLLKVVRLFVLIESEKSKTFERAFNLYVELFSAFEGEIDDRDIAIFTHRIKFYSDKFQHERALSLCLIIEPKLEGLSEELDYESVIIFYWFATIYFSLKDKKSSIEYAEKTLSIIERHRGKTSSQIDEKGITTITDQVLQIKASSKSSIPFVRTEKKYGRNDRVRVRYLDESTKDGKYKNFEPDVLANRCKVILVLE